MSEIDVEKAANISEEIYEEFLKASSKFPAFVSEHEGYAILLEEVDELWEVVKLNQKNPDRHNKCRKECIQVAAMALRFLYDCVPEWKQEQHP
jgi:hypothetical protein